jgi:hypothetical protein
VPTSNEYSFRPLLAELAKILGDCGESRNAELVRTALSGSDTDLESFLTSNAVWGGAGSLADQAGLRSGSRSDQRRAIEGILAKIGEMQIEKGNVNARTVMWVKAFRSWERSVI